VDKKLERGGTVDKKLERGGTVDKKLERGGTVDKKLERVQTTTGALMAYAVEFRKRCLQGVENQGLEMLRDEMSMKANFDNETIGALLFDLGDALEQLGEEPLELAVLVAEGDVDEATSS
jgi:hypothetical protein